MKKIITLAASVLSVVGLAAPTIVAAQDAFSAVIVTDIGGVDDKSFNQSAWEGLSAWGEEQGLEQGVDGFEYIQSNSDSDYVTNLNTAVQSNFDIIFGIGFKLETAINDIAVQYPDRQFAIVDSVVDQPNVASLTFKDHEASFLAGVAAALTTETDHVGFIGGVEGVVIGRFEAGFVAGVQAVNPDIEISIEYAGSFADAPKGRQIAAAMYSNGADVIFHASGATGNGLFSEAKDIVSNDPERNIWVIGVDLDQEAEGIVTIDGEERHLTLTSTLKGVGEAVKQFTEISQAGEFEGGNHVFGLADGGVEISEGNIAEEHLETIEEYRQQIIDGDIEVPEVPGE